MAECSRAFFWTLVCLVFISTRVDAFSVLGIEVVRKEVCYEPWGCFSINPPHTNSAGHLPQPPSALGLRYFLSTRGARHVQLHPDWPDRRLRRAVDVGKETKVVVHGYLDRANNTWVQDMTRELLVKGDVNVVVVDWGQGAGNINYLQVVANTRLVAKMAAAMMRRLMQIGAQPASLHLIGHSLGAHIAGYMGAEIPGIGRITGLDPAGPGFMNTLPEVRLDPTDAIFVDVIHTNARPLEEMGFGYLEQCGTADFYPNGGQSQPGCYVSLYGRLTALLRGQSITEIVACDHMRALYLFTESINSDCPFTARPCPDWRHLGPAQCLPCDVSRNCVTMGYDVKNATGVYYLETRPRAPYCIS